MKALQISTFYQLFNVTNCIFLNPSNIKIYIHVWKNYVEKRHKKHEYPPVIIIHSICEP